MIYDLVVIGGGAGGCFTAIQLAEMQPGARICILEAARKPLSKVEISGGGRCNVTHACFDPHLLTTYYPRGGNELLEAFKIFQPGDLISWFESHGVKIKAEEDGRMFPVTDDSNTIIQCFLQNIRKHKIELLLSTRATQWKKVDDQYFDVTIMSGRVLRSKNLLVASGSDDRVWKYLKSTGHHIIPPVPSLFTFNIPFKPLHQLMGISKPSAEVSIPAVHLKAQGPLLITHWGLSGPAVLKLSAWGARELNTCDYVFDLHVNWSGHVDIKAYKEKITKQIRDQPKKQIPNIVIEGYTNRLWKYLCQRAQIPDQIKSAETGKKMLDGLMEVLTNDVYRVTGKSTFKEEFVTAGGVDLYEVNILTFESRLQSNLYFAGEVLNIDAITGGFNFQAAWTAGYLAAKGIAESTRKS